MRRRALLAALGTAGAAGTAGCGAVGSDTRLADPTHHADSPSRRSIRFESDGEEIGSVGASGGALTEVIDIDTEIWHREGTRVRSVRFEVWTTPETDAAPRVALESPVEGDSSPPPSVSLYTPDRGRGTVVEITDFDDLADETISVVDFLVRPWTDSAVTVVLDAAVELADSGLLGGTYTLDGRLELEFPDFGSG